MIRYREYGESTWRRFRTELLAEPRRLRNPTDDEVADALRFQPRHYAGDIKQKYGTIETLTVTNLQALASSSNFTAGWTSAYVDNTSNLNLNSVAYGQITSGTTPTAGSVRCYVYAYDNSNSLTFTSAGTPGTEGALTITDTEMLDGFLVLLWSSDVDTTTNDVYAMPPRSVRQAFGFMPRKWALYVSHNTVAALKATSGSSFYVDHELRQYT